MISEEQTKLLLQEVQLRIKEKGIKFVSVNGGSSNRTYLIKREKKNSYILKIQRYCKLLEEQEVLRHFIDFEDDHHQLLYMAYRSNIIPEAYISISNWIEGEILNLSESAITYTQLQHYAKEAAQTVKRIHKIQCPFHNKRFDDTVDLKMAIEFINKNQIVFPHRSEILDMVLRLSEKKIQSPYGFIHMDLHLENMVFSEEGCNLIDMETLCCGSVWRDLIYAMELNFPQERVFWKLFLEEYFHDGIPEGFWEEMLRYVLVAFLMLMKSNWNNQTMERQYNLAEKIFKDYDGFKRIVPRWLEEK